MPPLKTAVSKNAPDPSEIKPSGLYAAARDAGIAAVGWPRCGNCHSVTVTVSDLPSLAAVIFPPWAAAMDCAVESPMP